MSRSRRMRFVLFYAGRLSLRRGAPQAVVDGLAEARFRNRARPRWSAAPEASRRLQIGEQMSGGLDEVAVFAEVQGGARRLGALGGSARRTAGPPRRAECSSRSGAPAPAARNGTPACRARAAWRRPPVRSPASCRSAPRWPPAARRRGGAGAGCRRGRRRWSIRPRPAAAPPSSTASMRPSRSPSTWSASVGLTRPERLAEGAATGRPACCRSAWARGWAGTRRPTLSRPARARSEIVQVGATGTTRVSGPGQNASASVRAVSSNRPWTPSGFEAVDDGRSGG